MLSPKSFLGGWTVWYHQLQYKGNQSSAVKAQAAAPVPSAHMKGVLSLQGATGGPMSAPISFYFLAIVLTFFVAWHWRYGKIIVSSLLSWKEQEYRSPAPWMSLLPVLWYSCTQAVYAFKERPNHLSALTGTEYEMLEKMTHCGFYPHPDIWLWIRVCACICKEMESFIKVPLWGVTP